jgi:hypothetical protein
VQTKLTRSQAWAACEALEEWLATHPQDEAAASAFRKIDAALARRENDQEDA